MHPAGYFQKITFAEGQRKFPLRCFYNVSQVLGSTNMVVSVMSLPELLFMCIFLSQGLCAYMWQNMHELLAEKTNRDRNLAWEEDDVNRWEREGMLPNLSAADVACWTELSFSSILGRSGTRDLQRAERCGREDWQETERKDLFREPLCVMTDWQDSEMFEMDVYSSDLEGWQFWACCVLMSSGWELSNWMIFFFYLSMRMCALW